MNHARRINLSLYQPAISAMNIHNAFLEVIETLRWGFTDLGYDCSVSLNEVDRRCQNIAFGWVSAFNAGNMHIYPPGTILYNFEQWSNRNLADDPVIREIARNFQIWDYSPGNIRRWQALESARAPYYAPVSFAPSLVRIAPAPEDIDILFVGTINANRATKLEACQDNIGMHRNSLVAMSGIWGAQRDAFIARAKLLLNLSYPNTEGTIFEVVRVSYYLANSKAVVCEHHPALEIEPDLAQQLHFAPADQLAAVCDGLLHDTPRRLAYAQAAHECFAQRDVRDVIRGFF